MPRDFGLQTLQPSNFKYYDSWCGELTYGPGNATAITMVEENLRAQGGKWYRLNPEQLKLKFPTFQFDSDTVGIVDEEAGVIRPEKCLLAFRVCCH